jgi:hypothetical protein
MVSAATLEELAQNPDLLFSLNARDFEELVAEVLAGFGWKVSLTSRTHDGGFDILAVSEFLPGLRSAWLVECKRYSQDHPVGVQIARAVLGAAHYLRIPNALIVTSSRFTKDAIAVADTFAGLHLVDFSGLVKWLEGYRPEPAGLRYLPSRSFPSCFVSHSSHDKEFVARLVAALKERGVEVWYAPDKLQPGEHLQNQLMEAIQSFDRVLVVLSESSVNSHWVEAELYRAYRREQKEGRRVLFPISLMPFEDLRRWSLIDPDTGADVARELRKYFIPDFSGWPHERSFQDALGRLVEALERAAHTAQHL